VDLRICGIHTLLGNLDGMGIRLQGFVTWTSLSPLLDSLHKIFSRLLASVFVIEFNHGVLTSSIYSLLFKILYLRIVYTLSLA
jgi:hypothetical protein